MDISSIVTPTLIVNDLFMVKPMTAITGYLTYMSYALGTKKGGVGGSDSVDSEGRRIYNTITNNPWTFGTMTEDRARYTSEHVVESFAYAEAGSDYKTLVLGWKATLSGTALANGSVKVNGVDAAYTAAESNGVVTITLTTALSSGQVARVAYVYDNITTPQEKLPTLVGFMSGINLQAKARRIAVEYNQITAFQA